MSTSIKKEDESKAKDMEQKKKLQNSSEEAVSSTKKQVTKKKAQIEHKQDEEPEPKNIGESFTTSRSPTDTSREQSEEKLAGWFSLCCCSKCKRISSFSSCQLWQFEQNDLIIVLL